MAVGSSGGSRPERATRDPRPIYERLQLRPRDLRMRAPAEAAVRARDHVLAADAFREASDALRDELRVLDDVRRVRDTAWDQDLSLQGASRRPRRRTRARAARLPLR